MANESLGVFEVVCDRNAWGMFVMEREADGRKWPLTDPDTGKFLCVGLHQADHLVDVLRRDLLERMSVGGGV